MYLNNNIFSIINWEKILKTLTIFNIIGSNYGPHIRKWGEGQKANANLGQCFIAIDPKKFDDGFETRLSEFMNFMRNMTPVRT